MPKIKPISTGVSLPSSRNTPSLERLTQSLASAKSAYCSSMFLATVFFTVVMEDKKPPTPLENSTAAAQAASHHGKRGL
jgi:hypothetical protein